MTLDCGTPAFHVLLSTEFCKKFCIVSILAKRFCWLQPITILSSKRGFGFRIFKQVFSVKIDLDKRFHRNSKNVSFSVFEVIDEGCEVCEVNIWSFNLWIGCQSVRNVHQEISIQVGINDVLLNVDKIIDTCVGLHVLDGFVVHLVPGCCFQPDFDSCQFFEILCKDFRNELSRWRIFCHSLQSNTFIWLTCSLPPCIVSPSHC